MKTTRIARKLGLGGNPLRRRTDKIEARVAALLLAVFLIGAPLLSVAAIGWAGHAGAAGQRAERSWRQVPAGGITAANHIEAVSLARCECMAEAKHGRSVGGPRPIRARAGYPRARFRRPGACTATASGDVSAGSNPAGGTVQRHKFEHFDNPRPTRRQAL